MEWDMVLVVMHEELNSSQTCVPGATIVLELLCHDTKWCITCSAIKRTNDLQKDRSGEEAVD
eukprot:13455468-Heterocapsa_arctica.AAC.1